MTEVGGLGLTASTATAAGNNAQHIPIAVSVGGRTITAQVADVSYGATAPGGYDRATITLNRPADPLDFAAYQDVEMYDTRNAGTVYAGRLRAPNSGGLVTELESEGGQAHLDDQTKSVIYVDQSLDRWVPMAADKSFDATVDEVNENLPSLRVQHKDNNSYAAGDHATWQYRHLQDTGQHLARFRWTADRGVTSADWVYLVATRVSPYGASGGLPVFATFSTTANSAGNMITTDFPATEFVVEIGMERTGGGGTTPDESYWVEWYDLFVRGTLMTALGVEITAGASYTLSTVTPAEVIADVIGRMLPKVDGATAVIGTSSVVIDQLAYIDGATPREILDDVIAFVGDWRYLLWEKNSSGKWTFDMGAYPSGVAMSALTSDDYQAPSGYEPLNRVLVRWKDAKGRKRTTVRTAVVPELDAAGLTRSGPPIDLGDINGSAALATLAGDAALAKSQFPTSGGWLVIRRPIVDMQNGRTLRPHELPRHMTGRLVRISDIQPVSYSATSTVRNGRDLFRIAAADYDSRTNSCTLALDSTYRMSNRLARLERALDRARR